MQSTTKPPLFDLGQLIATPGALAALEKSGKTSMEFLLRHVTGDWGDIPEEDRKENRFSLEKGFRLLTSYRTTANDLRSGAQRMSVHLGGTPRSTTVHRAYLG